MFFCSSSRQDEKTYFATLFSASSRLVVYLIEAGFQYDEFLCLFVCFFPERCFSSSDSALRCPSVQRNNSMVT